MGKKKRPTGTSTPVSEAVVVVKSESDTASSNLSAADKDPTEQQQDSCGVVVEINNAPIFKSAKFLRALKSSSASGKRNRVWKSLKQLSASERCQPGSVTYSYIDAAPSIRPVKKYSDVSGLKARYTDPLTKLRFANVSEFQVIRTLSPESVNAHLAVRKAAPI